MASSSLTQLQEECFFSHKIISIPQAMEMPKKITELPEKSTLVFYAESDNTEEALSFLKKVLMAVHLTPEQNVLLLCLTANNYFGNLASLTQDCSSVGLRIEDITNRFTHKCYFA